MYTLKPPRFVVWTKLFIVVSINFFSVPLKGLHICKFELKYEISDNKSDDSASGTFSFVFPDGLQIPRLRSLVLDRYCAQPVLHISIQYL